MVVILIPLKRLQGRKKICRRLQSLHFCLHLKDSPSHHRPFAGLAKDGCSEVLIDNLARTFQFRPTDEKLNFETQFKMSNLPENRPLFQLPMTNGT